MFQRLKNAVDARIAEEQARQKALASASPTSSGSPTSAVRRSTSVRSESPAIGPASRRKLVAVEGSNESRPDPAEFEKAFVIEDESEGPSRSVTPALPDGAGNGDKSSVKLEGGAENNDQASEITLVQELPPDVKAKLRKLEKLESRYQDLLRSYRIAHARAISIEPFEKTLKENTPLVSISDPDAFVEYINQLSLKGDMVMDELKRVSSDRDGLKKKFDTAEKEAASAKEELAALKKTKDTIPAQSILPKLSTAVAESASPEASIKSPAQAVLSIFSPKPKEQAKSKDTKGDAEEFFSYDDEVPQLQSDLKAKTTEIETLQAQVKSVQDELAAARENSDELAQSLEKATREFSESKSIREAEGKLKEAQKETIRQLEEKLQTTEEQLKIAQSNLTNQEQSTEEKIKLREAEMSKSNERLVALHTELEELQKLKAIDAKRVESLEQQVAKLNLDLQDTSNPSTDQSKSLAPESPAEPVTTPTTSQNIPATGAKKKNKKKKKGGNAGNQANTDAKDSSKDEVEDQALAVTASMPIDELNTEIQRLKDEVARRDVEIEKLQSKRKTESDLREEIENMQENLLNIGQEHVEAKDKIKQLEAEKVILENKLKDLEKQIADQKGEKAMSIKLESEYNALTAEFENLKVKSSTLQSDLGAAQQLATSRYKDLTDLRDVLEKAKPELKSLRAENATLKTAKDELTSKTGELRRMETREKDLKADFMRFKKLVDDRESEIKVLNEKVTQETNSRLRAEDQNRIAQRDLRRAEAEKVELSATGEKASRELAKVQEEATKLRSRVRELEDQVSKLNSECLTTKDELNLKNAQYLSAQNLVGSMRDQTSEMATQLKEQKEQSESFEEELAEVQRLLGERTREGETMRRLLADVDERTEAKVREMKERMEAAIEERDRAEDEASTNGRRRAREVDELKIKVRDAERDLKRAEQERDESEQAAKEWRKQREQLEQSSEKAAKEVREVNEAMGELRNALDVSEKQARDAEKQKMDIRRLLDEATQRYEKIQKSQKVLSEELRGFKSSSKLDLPSSRSSTDSRPSSNGRTNSMTRDATNGSSGAPMDYVYLKTILLQFLEQKDKKHQAQLVPVIGKLLHFDKKDEQKWIAAISSISVK